MYELVEAGGQTFFIAGAVNMGLWVAKDGVAVLIDSGNDKEAGRKVLQRVQERGWRLGLLANTHSHADHIGGNAWLHDRTGCAVLAPERELPFVRQPDLEAALLYGGCPGKALRNKFLLAQPSPAEALTVEQLPAGFALAPLPGHARDMVAVRTPDRVWFVGDVVFGEAILDKYAVMYLYDVGAYLASLEAVLALEGDLFVPAHAAPVRDLAALVALNRNKTLEIAERLTTWCKPGAGFDDLLERLFTAYRLSLNANQHALVGSTLRSYLSWLVDTGVLVTDFTANRLVWRLAV